MLSSFGGFSLREVFVGSCAEMLLLSAEIVFAAPIELVRLNGFSWYDSPDAGQLHVLSSFSFFYLFVGAIDDSPSIQR